MQNKQFSFSRNVWLTIGCYLHHCLFRLRWSEKQIVRANDLRHQSCLLANELRQSSDDLTIMASTYVLTSNPTYKNPHLIRGL